jgi:hypothetical protein
VKYTLVVRQAAAVEAGLVGKVSFADLGFLDYLRGWFFSQNSKLQVVEGRKFVWLHYERAVEELPLLFNPKAKLTSRKNQLAAMISRLRTVGMVETIRAKRRLFFRLTDLALRLTQRYERPSPTAGKSPPNGTPPRDETVTPGQDRTVTSFRDEYLPTHIDETGTKESERKETPPSSPCEGEAESILAFWNSFPELQKAITLPRIRARKIRRRLADPFWREHWREGIQRAAASAFLTGNGPHDWRATFDWFLGGDSLVKIIEGTYDNRTQQSVKLQERWEIERDLASVGEQLEKHPRSSWPGNVPLPAEVRAGYDNLLARLKALEAELAGAPRVTRQPGDEKEWWTCPLVDLSERIRVEKHLGNQQVAARLAEIYGARCDASRRW